MVVTKDSIIGDVLDYDVETAKFFFEIGMHCLGCPASRGESIEDMVVVEPDGNRNLTKSPKEMIEIY